MRKEAFPIQIYVVKRGDTLYQIANRYRTTVNEIVATNEIPNPNRLVVGQTIVIPIAGEFYEVRQVKPPYVFGHEFSGEVVQVGENVTTVKEGEYVSAETHIVCGKCLPCVW